MKKSIIFGSFFAGFFLLITPCINSIEYHNQNQMIDDAKEPMDYASFVKITRDEWMALLKNVIQNPFYQFILAIVCMFVILLMVIFALSIALLPVAYQLYLWVEQYCVFSQELDSLCRTCVLEEFFFNMQLHSQMND